MRGPNLSGRLIGMKTNRDSKSAPKRLGGRLIARKWLFLGIIVGAALVGIAAVTLVRSQPIPRAFQEQATYPLYYPDGLPKGAEIDRESFRHPPDAPEVLLYQLRWSNGINIVISEQARPEGANFQEFEQTKLSAQRAVITPYGKGIVGRGEGKTIGSLITEKTWVLVTAPAAFTYDDMDRILSGLKET